MRTLRTSRKAPNRFLARPSKQGWGVTEGDEAFLNDDENYFAGVASSGGSGVAKCDVSTDGLMDTDTSNATDDGLMDTDTSNATDDDVSIANANATIVR